MKAVIFDMDGLLIDSEPLWHEAEKAAFATIGLHLRTQDCLLTTGLRVDEVVSHWNGPPELAAQIVERVTLLIKERGQAKPGVIEALDACAGRQLAIASSSASSIITAVLERLGIADRFSAVHSAENETQGKPHPAVYLSAAAKLGVHPSECVAVEDSPNGVAAAKAAGMICIAVPDVTLAGDDGFEDADFLIPSLHKLASVLP